MSAARHRSDRGVNALAGLVGAVLVAAAVAGVVLLTPSHPPRQPPASSRAKRTSALLPARASAPPPFAPGSIWNVPLAATAPMASNSSELVTQLVNQVSADGAWINTSSYSVPVYTVGADQPTVPVILDTSGPGSANELAAIFKAGVPIPPGATAAPGSDEHMVVLQPSTNTMWEFWLMHKVDGLWHARWGGKMEHVSSNPGYFTDPPDWGATATSIPLLAGLIRFSDLSSGDINHALAFAIPQASAAHVLPAQRSDGSSHASDAIPEGTRFRIPASVDLDALHLPRVTLMMARAVQRYGMIVRDQAGAVSFYAQQATGNEPDPYYGRNGFFGGMSPARLLRNFPWRDLKVVAPPNPSG